MSPRISGLPNVGHHRVATSRGKAMRINRLAMTLTVLCTAALLGSSAHAAQGDSERNSSEAVPRTYDGAGGAFKSGGKELGEGFRGVGRGIKDTFTGRASAGDYREGKNIGTGFKDLGRGVAGGARATGRTIKQSVKGSSD